MKSQKNVSVATAHTAYKLDLNNVAPPLQNAWAF